MISENRFIELDGRERVSAVLSGPDRASDLREIGLIFAHGAGNDMHNPLIVAISEGLAAEGFTTLRFNFPYKEKGKKSPDSQAKLIHTWQRAWQTMQGNDRFPVAQIVTVGKSMGGRVASQMVAEGQMPAAALIFLGYPLHAPGKKEQLRDAHLYRIDVPMLFFAGTRDPLCNLHKLKSVSKRLHCPHELEIIDGGNHSLLLPKSASRDEADVTKQISARCLAWLKALR